MNHMLMFQIWTGQAKTKTKISSLSDNEFSKMGFAGVRIGGHMDDPSSLLMEKNWLMKKWGVLRGCFDETTRNLIDGVFAYGSMRNYRSSQHGWVMNVGRNGDFYFLATFKDADGFLNFNKIMAHDLNEKEKIGMMAFWQGTMGHRYDFDRMEDLNRKSYTGKDVIDEFIHSTTSRVGICGDINGSASHLIAQALGLRQSTMTIFAQNTLHAVSFVKGKEGYYLVDYGDAWYLGKDLPAAIDLATIEMGEYSPFLGRTASMAFEEGSTEKFLLELSGLAGKKLKKGFSSSLAADSYANVGGNANITINNARIGVFALKAPLPMTDIEGITLDLHRHEGKTGHIFIPRVFFSAMRTSTAGKAYPMLLAQAVPYLYKNHLGSVGVEVRPMEFDMAAIQQSSSRMVDRYTSSVGLTKVLGKDGNESEAWAKADIRYVEPVDVSYSKNIKIAHRFSAGFRSKKNSFEISYKPQSIGNLVDLKGSHEVVAGSFNFLITLEAKLLETLPDGKQHPCEGVTLGLAVTLTK